MTGTMTGRLPREASRATGLSRRSSIHQGFTEVQRMIVPAVSKKVGGACLFD